MSAIYLSFSVIAIAWGGHGTGGVKPVRGRSSTGAALKRTVILEKSQPLNLMNEKVRKNLRLAKIILKKCFVKYHFFLDIQFVV